ncbi:uncharacterized protein Dwil_GK27997 [Drosophila willistoni]|uniref:Endonuclease/exonuclease/phosphatase domain-containing protein n=1 Tax=Drosophila willistoni TaxID=7260 RepID=A0A0Q9WVX2_DROWI|nr:protein angel [Drosophila willistoni]KRG00256.1 uncharacterized protein Dwil_GK27997 [Drosophila willistoni]
MEPRYDFKRKWVTLSSSDISRQRAPSFKLVSYNILAQDLLLEHINLYLKIKQEWLTWRRRFENLQREITKLNPDILCLQEMQYDHLPLFVQGLQSRSNGKRLEYVYKKKTGHRTDGCAIIYDSLKFNLVEQRCVELYDDRVTLLNRENVALLTKFRLKDNQKQPEEEPKEFIVATTHLLYNPKRQDVRCAQITKLLEELQTFTGLAKPIILTGDFNSELDSSPIEVLLRTQHSQKSFNFEVLDTSESAASTLQHDWITVDYMLRSNCAQSKHQLQVDSIYTLPSIDSCCETGPIPNHYLGSDHYSLGAVFRVV